MRNSVSEQRSTSSAKFMNQNIVSMKKLCEGFPKFMISITLLVDMSRSTMKCRS